MLVQLRQLVLLALFIPMVAIAEPLDSVAAVINDNVITESEVSKQVEQVRQQMMANHTEIPAEKVLRKQVLQHLIDVNLQLQLAKQNHLTVDSTELNEAINRIAESNHLSVSQLRQALERQGMSWKDYRTNLRKEIVISHVQQKAINKEIVVSNQQVEDYLKTAVHRENAQITYHIQNIVIPLPDEPTTKQLEAAINKAHSLLDKIKKGADFSQMAIAESSGEFALEGGDLGDRHLAELPEVFAKRVVDMKVGEVSEPIRTGNGFQLIKLIAVGGDNMRHEVNKTHVRHILLKQDASITSEEVLKRANNLYQQLISGKDFAELAKHYSLDVGSAVNGGDLGWVVSGELVPQFEKEMNKLAIRQISKPVKSPFGWHLIQVLERKIFDDTASFEREQVRQLLQQRKFTESVQSWLQHVRSEAYVKVMNKELA